MSIPKVVSEFGESCPSCGDKYIFYDKENWYINLDGPYGSKASHLRIISFCPSCGFPLATGVYNEELNG